MGSISSEELRVRRLEEWFNKLQQALNNATHKLGQLGDDSGRDSQPPQAPAGIKHFFAQADGDIAAAGTPTDNTLGTGAAALLRVIEGARYQLDPPISVVVLNSVPGVIDHLTYLELIFSQGKYTVIVGSCVPAGLAAPVYVAPGT